MKRGFTLLELIVVIIIIGILATLGFTQYTKVVEKGRTAEARMILGQIRTAEEAYKLENGSYTDNLANLSVNVQNNACVTSHYFKYIIIPPAVTSFSARAERCIAGGKTPNVAVAYVIDLNVDAAGITTWGGTQGY